jgi:outer membrane protein OmpA-like peptidoglycan-associated protein
LLTALAAMVAVGGCASVTPTPAAMVQAHTVYASLEAQHAEQRVEGDMIRARATIDTARSAVSQGQNAVYVEGMAAIALRMVQIADAHFGRSLAQSATDSLQKLKLTRQLAAAQARQATLEAERAEAEQRAAAATARADSLRRAADAANAQLEQAMSQLQSLVVEMTDLKQTSRGLVISLSDILFDLGQATLKPGAEVNVQKISAVLKQYPDHKISVEGYTDSTGSDTFNQQLSENRAVAVRDALVAGGLDSAVISVHGYGKAMPVATNATPDGRQQNRRVEIVVLGAGTIGDLLDPRAAPGGASASSRSGVDSTATRTPPRDSEGPSVHTTSSPGAIADDRPPSDSARHP